MPKLKKKVSTVTIPTAWLIAGVLVLLTAAGAKAVYKSSVQTAVPVNEVRTQGVVEGTYTGTVSRESATVNGKSHEQYFLTTDSGSKYLLVGLKTTYTPRPNTKTLQPDVPPPVKGDSTSVVAQGKAARPTATTPAAPKTRPRNADTQDVNAFEEYVGKRVTITGMVLGLNGNGMPKATRQPAASAVAKPDRPGNGNGGNNNGKPMATVQPREDKPNDGSMGREWDFDRLVVRSITLAQ